MSLLTTLGCHDLSAMRDVIGMPEKCLVATRSDDAGGKSAWYTALFQYQGFKAYFEVSRVLFHLLNDESMDVSR